MVSVTNWNLSNISTTNSTFVTLMQETSRQTHYVPGTLMLLAIVFVLFISLKAKGLPTTNALAATCFAQAILAILMYPMQIITGVHLLIALILLPISGLILYMNR